MKDLHFESGGVVTDKGLAIVHGGEPILTPEQLKELIGEACKGDKIITMTINIDNLEFPPWELLTIAEVPPNYRPS